MSIRRCTKADAESVAELGARACSDDALLGDFMHPYRKDYPRDFVAYFRSRFLRTLADASHHHVVTCEVNQGREVITGYAEWHRRHTGDKKPPADADATQNRAANPAYPEAFERAHVFVQGHWTGARAETWYLGFLIVDPPHQRKGLGRELVLYGLELADKEGVCASVIASEVGDGLYVSCGFEPVGYMQEGEGNPLRDIPGGRILFREPASK